MNRTKILENLEKERPISKTDFFYEKMCNEVEKIIKIRLGPEQEKKFQEAINFSYLKISPTGPVSLCVALAFIIVPIEVLLLLLNVINGAGFIVFLISTFFLIFYLYNYPFLLSRIIRTKASTEIVLTVLYMSISMREVSNLENAIEFAASNLTGPLSYDLKKLIWDLRIGNYTNAEHGLDMFTNKWVRENQEFIDSIQLIKTSVQQPYERRLKMLDEAVNVILNGTAERMENYAQELKMPIMLVYGLGVMLPVMSLVIFPVVMIFLQGIINTSFMIIFYDLILPIFLYWFINMNLERKPPIMSQPDISHSFEIAPPGKFKVGEFAFDILPLSLIILTITLTIGGYFLYDYNYYNSACRKWQEDNWDRAHLPKGLTIGEAACKELITDFMKPTVYSSIVIWGISLSIISYCYLDSMGKTKLRDKVRKLEGEFSEALFQLGHQITTGHPIENALERSKEAMKKYEISNFYDRILRNIKIFGMTFQRAIFDEEYGAIKFYPSEIIRSVMRIISEASNKGINLASIGMLTISDYLKGMHKVEQMVKELLSEIVSSMKFLAMALAPLVAGVTVAMAIIIMNILTVLSLEISTINQGVKVPGGSFLDLWKGSKNVEPHMFQLVIGIYIIETTVLLSMFVNGIERGEDIISERETLWKNLLFSTLIYTFSLFLIYMVFGGMISSLWEIT